nr:uncharacterized protein LOC105346736 [Crassostrea gigas]
MDDKAITGKRRSQNWQDDKEVMFFEEVKTRSGALFGLMKGSGAKGKLKVTREREWQLIADKLNSLYNTKRRTWEEVKKNIIMSNQEAKKSWMELNAQKLVVVPLSPLSHKERRHFCVLQMESHISLVYRGVLIQMLQACLQFLRQLTLQVTTSNKVQFNTFS